MFFYAPIWANRLPDKVLCITFDDGPDQLAGGPQTLNLGQFLFEYGVPATFFVLGQRAKGALDTLVALRNMGHLIASHTDSHPNLVKTTGAGVDPVSQVVEADLLIRNTLLPNTGFFSDATYFRPPYGRWRHPERGITEIADALNREKLLGRCVGPIHWDIDSRDWACWREGESAETSATICLERIEKGRRGIVLMHDSNFEEDIRRNNRTYELCRLVIPELQKRGYRFIRLDAIPQVASAALVTQRFCLKTLDDGNYVSINAGARENIVARAASFGEHEEFGLVPLSGGYIAIRAYNGQFLSVQDGEGGAACTLVAKAGPSERFELLPTEDGNVAVKAVDREFFIGTSPETPREIFRFESL